MKKKENNLTLPPRVGAKRERIFEIDYLRGFAVILMILYHLCYDLCFLFSDFFSFPDCGSVPQFVYTIQSIGEAIIMGPEWVGLFTVLQHFFSTLFMFICGISCFLSRNNLKRGIQLSYLCIIMTIGLDAVSTISQTALGLDINVHIYFGILHSLAFAILAYAIVDHFFKSYWADFIVALLFVILVVTVTDFSMPTQSIGSDYWTYKQPSYVVPNLHKLILGTTWDGDDYFYPFYTTAVVFFGASFGKLFYAKKEQRWPKKFITPVGKSIAFVGRHSLETYVIHQALVFLLLYAILAPFGATIGGTGNLRCF